MIFSLSNTLAKARQNEIEIETSAKRIHLRTLIAWLTPLDLRRHRTHLKVKRKMEMRTCTDDENWIKAVSSGCTRRYVDFGWKTVSFLGSERATSSADDVCSLSATASTTTC